MSDLKNTDGASRGFHDHCLMCGAQNPLSLGLSFEAMDENMVHAHFQAHAGLQGYDEILHGGVIAALLDAAMTHCLYHRGIQGLTVDLNVRYNKPVPCDALLSLRGWLTSAKPPLYYLKADLSCRQELMASAEARFMLRQEGANTS